MWGWRWSCVLNWLVTDEGLAALCPLGLVAPSWWRNYWAHKPDGTGLQVRSGEEACRLASLLCRWSRDNKNSSVQAAKQAVSSTMASTSTGSGLVHQSDEDDFWRTCDDSRCRWAGKRSCIYMGFQVIVWISPLVLDGWRTTLYSAEVEERIENSLSPLFFC
jgi:hypothetical protein